MWEKVKLGDVLNTSSGGTPSKSKSEYFKGGDIPWILSGDLNKNEIIESKNYITDLGLKKSSAKIFPKNSILIAMYGATIGKASILRIEASTNQAICCIFPNPKYNSKFLYYYFKNIQDELIQLGMGNAQPNISQSVIKELEIPLPPLPVQEKIAEILDKADELRRKDKDLQAKYDELAQAIFIDMFGDPVRNEKGWEVKKLRELGTIITGNTPSRANNEYYGGYIEWIKTDNILSNRIYPNEAKEYLSESGAKLGRKVSSQSILVTCIAGSKKSIGNCCLTDRTVAFNQQINAVTNFNDSYRPVFLYRLFKEYQPYIQNSSTDGMKKIITKSEFEKLSFIVPPIALQEAFAKKIELINQLKAQTNSEKSEELFQSLLQKAFKGELVS